MTFIALSSSIRYVVTTERDLVMRGLFHVVKPATVQAYNYAFRLKWTGETSHSHSAPATWNKSSVINLILQHLRTICLYAHRLSRVFTAPLSKALSLV